MPEVKKGPNLAKFILDRSSFDLLSCESDPSPKAIVHFFSTRPECFQPLPGAMIPQVVPAQSCRFCMFFPSGVSGFGFPGTGEVVMTRGSGVRRSGRAGRALDWSDRGPPGPGDMRAPHFESSG